MTAEENNSRKSTAQSHAFDTARDEADAASTQASRGYEIGYGRPPAHSRFKPGQSGNPRGRPKGKRNMRELRREAYVQPVKLANGRQVPAIVAVDTALLGKALKGDPRAALMAVKMATDIGVYEEIEVHSSGLTLEEIRALTDEELK